MDSIKVAKAAPTISPCCQELDRLQEGLPIRRLTSLSLSRRQLPTWTAVSYFQTIITVDIFATEFSKLH